MHYTIDAAKKSNYIDKVILSTDNLGNVSLAESLGAECPFTRPPDLSEEWVNLDMVQKYSLEQLERLDRHPDLMQFDVLVRDVLDETVPSLPSLYADCG